MLTVETMVAPINGNKPEQSISELVLHIAQANAIGAFEKTVTSGLSRLIVAFV
jgi:hypothetical protein